MTARNRRRLTVFPALLAGLLPLAAMAQTIGYGPLGGGSSASGGSSAAGGGSAPQSADAPESAEPAKRPASGKRAGVSKKVEISPYIEAGQVVTAELSPGDDVLTYSRIAAGVEMALAGRNNGASVSLRYERQIGWSDRASNGDVISGLARGYTTIAPGLRLDAGALATRTSVESSGAGLPSTIRDGDSVTQVYSVYAGPSLTTHVGDVGVNANYRLGYTKVEYPKSFAVLPGQRAVDVFDDSVTQAAGIHAGVKPFDVLPVGLGAGATYYREDISNLDQRVEDFAARADVTVPVSQTVALVGGVGYEHVEISSRDALRDAAGDPVVGPNGRYVTDKSSPRVLAYDVDGLIWDAGVIWRPSRRTALEAHIGRRYGSTSVYGSFAYAPNARSSFNVSVYDNVAGFGGQVNRALADLPSEFSSVRNPLTGDIGGCVATLEKGSCLPGSLSSVRSSTFRARGVMATYGVDLGRYSAGIGGGYDRRRFIGARGTVLEAANGQTDENFWLSTYLNGRIDQHSSFATSLYANWFQSGSVLEGDTSAVGATAAYNRLLMRNLTATAALGLDGVKRDAPLEDDWTASALVSVRYNF